MLSNFRHAQACSDESCCINDEFEHNWFPLFDLLSIGGGGGHQSHNSGGIEEWRLLERWWMENDGKIIGNADL